MWHGNRDGNQNLRTQFERIIKRAGVKPWMKLFHNLRASRQTELLDTFPIKAVCDWLGNSSAVALEHYAQVTATHFETATTLTTGGMGGSITATAGGAAHNPAHLQISLANAAQNPAQSDAEMPRNASQANLSAHEKSPVFEGFSLIAESFETAECPGEGSNLHPLTWTSS